ncbi:MAG: hypothetical protein HRU15_20175 [Planctomycetes bacterium]|nr:hypothetical protein [Planctomycetota bacterium]
MLCSCGGGGSSTAGASAGSGSQIESAPVVVSGVWWASNASPAYALDINQDGKNLILDNQETAQIIGSTIELISLEGDGSISSDGSALEITYHFQGYGTVHTEYQRLEDVCNSAHSVVLPSTENVSLHGGFHMCSFAITESEYISFETSGPEDGDTWLFLFNENMELIMQTDDPGFNYYAFMDLELGAGTYYVAVSSWDDELDFVLDITTAVAN